MKKIILLVVALMMVTSVAFAEDITSGNLKDLKGTWRGWLTTQSGATNSPAELVILNDTVPVQARLKLEMLPESMASMMGSLSAGGAYTLSSDDGKISTQGSLMFAGTKNFFEFFLKRNKLDGWFYFNGARGDLVLYKK